MKKTIELSKLNPELDIDEVVNFLLDNGYDSVADDTMQEIEILYLYDEMYDVWNELKKRIK